MKTATPTVPKSEEIDAVWNTKIKIVLVSSRKNLHEAAFLPCVNKTNEPQSF